jgi:DNA-binding beta-propeller fold protein YncE
VTPITTATNTAGKPITIKGAPPLGAIAITPGGQKVYVAGIACSAGLCAYGWVTPISVATNTALKPIKVGAAPDAIAITP